VNKSFKSRLKKQTELLVTIVCGMLISWGTICNYPHKKETLLQWLQQLETQGREPASAARSWCLFGENTDKVSD